MKHALLTTLLICTCLTLHSQKKVAYPVQEIPAALLPYAHAVVRQHSLELEIKSPAELETRYKLVVTVLNAKGRAWAEVVLPYDKFNTLRDLRCQVYDAQGIPGKVYEKNKFQDVTYFDDVTMADDSRYRYLDLSNQHPPYTLELSYTIQSKSALFCPDFFPQPHFHTAVEQSNCTVKVPAGETLRYLCARSPEPDTATENGFKMYKWAFQNLRAIPDEPYNLPVSSLAPAVRLNASKFQIGAFSGDFDSWNGLARWNQQMVAALPALDIAARDEIRRLTAGLPEREKIRAVYRYVQNSTRYVSIQLGVGGWQPFDPNFVHQKKYGDCKALSWYTKSLLDAAGIPAYYTLVSAGDAPRALDPDFPSSPFNHVILTVPTAAGDTLHLECTSQTNPPGYTGSFTGGREALLIDGAAGRIVHIPAPPAPKNLRTDSVFARISDDQASVQLRWRGRYQGMAIEDAGFAQVAAQGSAQGRRAWVEQNHALKGGQLAAYEMMLDTLGGAVPSGYVALEASSAQLVNLTPKRMYFQPNFFQAWTETLNPDNDRISPVFRRFGRAYLAKLRFELPAGWSPERLPAAVDEQTLFGRYSRSVSFADGVLSYRRQIVLDAGTFPAAEFNALVEFFKKMKKWDGEQAVFVR